MGNKQPCGVSGGASFNDRSLLLCFLQLRKPVVEKMRRDRINSSIEQLKLLLEKEFQRHQPNSKLEKADILEMTVSYLKQQSQLQDQKSECRAGISHLDLLPGLCPPRHPKASRGWSTPAPGTWKSLHKSSLPHVLVMILTLCICFSFSSSIHPQEPRAGL